MVPHGPHPSTPVGESSGVIDILLPVTFYFNSSTGLDNVKNL